MDIVRRRENSSDHKKISGTFIITIYKKPFNISEWMVLWKATNGKAYKAAEIPVI